MNYITESREEEYSYFLCWENDLESVVEAYFNLIPVEYKPEDDNSSDFSSDEEGDQDDNIDSHNDFEFPKLINPSMQKWRHSEVKAVDICKATKEKHAALLFKLKR